MKAKKVTVSNENPNTDSSFFNLKARPRLMILPKQKSKKDGLCTIYVELSLLKQMPGKTVRKFKRVPTKERVLAEHWSQIKEEVKPKNQNHAAMNSRLKDLMLTFETYGRDKIDNATYLKSLPEELKTYDKYFNEKHRKTLLEYLEDYIKIRQANSVRGTWKEFRTLHGRVKHYQELNHTTLYFESIDFDFADNLRKWAKVKDLDPNTLKKTFDALKTFLNYYVDDQRKLNFFLAEDYKRPKFKAVTGTHASDPIPLYPEEVEALEKFKPIELFYQDKKGVKIKIPVDTVERCKKLFLLSCYSSLRFSDVLRLTPGNFRDGHIVIRPSKTDKKSVKDLHIPLLRNAIEILKTIDYKTSNIALTNQTCNRVLTVMFKEIAQSVWGKTNEGLNRFMKEYEYDLQGGRVELDKRKYELVSFHSGRQTFITNCLISGIDVPTTMGFSGHSKYETFKKYISLSEAYKKEQHHKINKLFDFSGK